MAATDRSWMYKRENFVEFVNGVRQFLNHAFSDPRAFSEYCGLKYIPCPCSQCDNSKHLVYNDVSDHLTRYGFCTCYERWVFHGEPYAAEHSSQYFEEPVQATSPAHASPNLMANMLHDIQMLDVDRESDSMEEPPNATAQAFFDMLGASQQSLWDVVEPQGSNFNVLQAITECLELKAACHMSEHNFDRWLKLIKAMLPRDDKLPATFYAAKRLVRGLGLHHQQIDACPNNCMLYYKDNEKKDKCDVCNEQRYKKQKPGYKGKPVAQKSLRYLSIGPRLQRMYLTKDTAELMRWHAKPHTQNGLMVHPADGKEWKNFKSKHSEFAKDPRNCFLGMSTDGFQPYSSNSSPYSCWPVYVFPYNLPPDKVLKEDSMFLTLVIPGPKHPGRDIDIFLQPLIDELKVLWEDGLDTYDCLTKTNFKMKVALLWTINDFPAYGDLSGWCTKGKLACPHCGANTKSFYLKHGRKVVWFDCTRCFLPSHHHFRRQKNKFLKDTQELDPPPKRLSGEEVKMIVNGLGDIKWGKNGKLNQICGYGVTHNWQKKSIFFDLPYWSSLDLRHNLDLMHIEKNFGDNIMNTVFDFKKKTKDKIQSRLDLPIYCKRSKLHLTPGPKSEKPKASYALSTANKEKVLIWLRDEVKFPDGYASNWSRCINLTERTIRGLKSHDVHVFVERLMPVAFRDFVPEAVWEVLNEVSIFFREICAKQLDIAKLNKLENNIIVTMCKLEKIFPPAFFDVMEHLVVHVAHEAKLGGPVQFRWMFAPERRNKDARMMIKNKARVEGSIVEAYVLKEISTFCSHYFDPDRRKFQLSKGRHDVGPEMPLDGKPAIFNYPGKGRGICLRNLSLDEMNAAQMYVLDNSGCPFIDGLSEAFNASVRARNPRRTLDEASLQRIRVEKFCPWIREKTQYDPNCDIHIKNLCFGPKCRENTSYKVYDINGVRFDTYERCSSKATRSSGVCIVAEDQEYYGVIKDIVELVYEGYDKIVVFECYWFDPISGVRVDKKHGLVEVKYDGLRRLPDPFVLAAQAIQVIYLKYASANLSEWMVAIKTGRKPNWDHQMVRTDSDPDIFQEQWSGCDYEVTGGEALDMHTVLVDQGILEAVDQGELAKLTSCVQSTARDDETGAETEEEEEEELNNDEGTDQLEEADEPYGW